MKVAFKELEIKDPATIVMHLKQPAILPKKYFQQVGADGFARAPIGSGPYRIAKNAIGSTIQLEALD